MQFLGCTKPDKDILKEDLSDDPFLEFCRRILTDENAVPDFVPGGNERLFPFNVLTSYGSRWQMDDDLHEISKFRIPTQAVIKLNRSEKVIKSTARDSLGRYCGVEGYIQRKSDNLAYAYFHVSRHDIEFHARSRFTIVCEGIDLLMSSFKLSEYYAEYERISRTLSQRPDVLNHVWLNELIAFADDRQFAFDVYERLDQHGQPLPNGERYLFTFREYLIRYVFTLDFIMRGWRHIWHQFDIDTDLLIHMIGDGYNVGIEPGNITVTHVYRRKSLITSHSGPVRSRRMTTEELAARHAKMAAAAKLSPSLMH